MRTYDLSPLWRSTIGFDRLFDLAEMAQRAGVIGVVATRDHGEPRREVLGDRPVEVATAEEVIAVMADHTEEAVAGLEQ